MKLTKVIKTDKNGHQHQMWAGPEQLAALRSDPRIEITRETADFDAAAFEKARADAMKPKQARKEAPKAAAEPEAAQPAQS